MSCQPPTHMCKYIHTHTHTHIHTLIIYGRCYLSLPPELGECQPYSTCGQRLITPIQMQNYDCFSTACKPRGGWNYISDVVIAGKLFVLHPVIPPEQRRNSRLVKGIRIDRDKVRYWWVKGAGTLLWLNAIYIQACKGMKCVCLCVCVCVWESALLLNPQNLQQSQCCESGRNMG